MKKRYKQSRLLFTLALVIAMTASGCSNSVEKEALKVGVRDDIVGLGYLNSTTDQYYGLEIDIANELAKDIGYKEVEFVTVQPENRKDMLMKGRVDCLIAAYSISDVRKKNFDFSDPYYKDQIKVMTQKSSLFDQIEDLKGAKIGVLSGVITAVEFASKMNELGVVEDFNRAAFDANTYNGGLYFESFNSYGALSMALETGQVDAICVDGSIANAYMNEERMFLDVVLSEQDYGIATQKGSPLSKEVELSMTKMLSDGTINTLIDKWD